MSAATINLIIEKGAKFNKQFIWKDSSNTPVDLSNYEARMQIRETVDSATVIDELTTANGGITLGGSAGTIDLYLGATETDAIAISSGVYDLEIYDPLDDDDVTRLVEGSISIKTSVTR
jgi:hypothetical protein